MKILRILSAFLALLMLCTVALASCTQPGETPSGEETTVDETTSETTDISSGDDETTKESEEETTVIVDVMIGDTLEAEPAADFTVSKVFSDYMVVQRGEHIRVWGFAPESENGKKVSGEFKGMFAEAIIENGEWCITFGARLSADTVGAEMTIYAGDNKTVTFKDVLVGDVYLILGQSNAALAVSESIKGGNATDINEDSPIRLNFLNGGGGTYTEKGTDYVYKDLENTTLWTKTSQAQTLRFSAIGYYFAQEMVKKSGNTVPVGLMEVAVGGAPLASFLPNDLAELYQSDYYSVDSGKYISTRDSSHLGRYLYNCYLAPASRYAVAGVLWYQGESDNPLSLAQVYGDAFGDLVERLRSTHNVINKDIPVFVVEFPTQYQKPADYTGSEAWHFLEVGTIRAFMGLLPSTVENCYLAASSDLWTDTSFPNSLHPNCKPAQAKRLADIAEVVIFKNGTLDSAMGPIFGSAELSEDKKSITITFTNVGDGLTTADGGVDVKGIWGFAENSFGLPTPLTPVSAKITANDQITVTFDEPIKAVAYNYYTTDVYGEDLNLCNSARIPAAAFVSPYTEKDTSGFKASDFLRDSNKKVKRVGKCIDYTQVNGKSFAYSSESPVVESNGSVMIGTGGWIGFKYEILLFGYSIDGSDAIFDNYPINAEEAVVNAAGTYAERFVFNLNLSTLDLAEGTHNISFLALVASPDGFVAVEFLSFSIEVVSSAH